MQFSTLEDVRYFIEYSERTRLIARRVYHRKIGHLQAGEVVEPGKIESGGV